MVIRGLRDNEKDLLRDFLYEAIFIPEGMDPPPRDIIERPELKLYYEDFGSGEADFCFVAEDEKTGFKTVDENSEEYIMVCML